MDGPSKKFLHTLLPGLLFAAATLAMSAPAVGQGFSSVSTSPPPAAAATASAASEVGAPAVPAASAAPSSAPGLDPPAAQLASVGFNSVSGSTPSLPVADTMPAGGGPSGAGSNASFEQADKVIVDKGDRRLYLLKQERVVAEYPIKLGLNPYGHKQQEGDFRTPEGKYTLVRRNPRSEFFLSIQVSYPNREDAAWAKENGWMPGGLIMIHGQPNIPKRPAEFYANRDWTDGCIALSNADMVDVWLRTTVGIPIEIRP